MVDGVCPQLRLKGGDLRRLAKLRIGNIPEGTISSDITLLNDLAHAVGIFYAPSALFVVAFGFVLVLLLHFSVAVSRLADQNKVLAQRVALLEERQRAADAAASDPRSRFREQDEEELPEREPAATSLGGFE